MPIQGDHQTLSVPDLLDFIIHRKLNGTLVIATHNRDRSFAFVNGNIAYAVLNEPGHLIGDTLSRELDLDQELVEEIHRELGPGDYLGQVLVDRGLLDRRDLDGVVARQIRRALRETLRFKQWAFHFQEEEARIPLGSCISTQSVLLDLIREQDEWNRIGEVFFDLEGTLIRHADSIHSRRFAHWPEDLPPPGRVLQEVDGRRNVRTLLEESAYPIYSLACGLAELVDQGLIELVPPNDVSSRRPPLALPVLPNLSSRIFELLRRPPDLGAIEELMLCDPILIAKTLRLVHARTKEMGDTWSLSSGLWQLGPVTLRSILLAEATRRLFLAPTRFTWTTTWSTSYLTSLAARDLAQELGTVDPEHAQVAGLLHNVGSLVLAAIDEDQFNEVQRRVAAGEPLREAESAIFGTDNSRVGSLLAESWGFPPELRTVIREHDGTLEHPRNRLIAIVRLALELVRNPDERSRLSRRHAKKLNLAAPVVERIREETRDREGRLARAGVIA